MNEAAQTLISDIELKLSQLKIVLSGRESAVEKTEIPVENIKESPKENFKPKKIFQMFPSNQDPSDLDDLADAAMEQGDEQHDDEEGYDELEPDALDDIDDDLDEEENDDDDEEEDSDLVKSILACTAEASRFHGISAEDIAKKLDYPKYKLVKILKDLFLNNRIERVGLRPLTYRSIIESSTP